MNKIYIMGDIHGSFKPIRDFHMRHNTNKEYNIADKTIILLGDAGLNFFFNYRDEEFKRKLGRYPFTYFVVRGNHEERPSICVEKTPDKWHREPFWGGQVWVENDYPYIKYAEDFVSFYYIPSWIDYMPPENPLDDDIEVQKYYKTLVIPGAYSVDKYKRLEMGWSWFPQEQLSEDERLAGLALIEQQGWNCDLVLSHTCPVCYEPTDLFLPIVDQSTVEKDMEKYLGQIECQLDYSVHLWGHYHQYREYPREIGEPCPKNPRQLMLFNDYAVELEDVMTNEILIDRL